MYAESTTTQGLLFVPVLVVYTNQWAAEGEYFAKSDENRVMDLAQWWAEEARHQHCASKDAQCHSGDELEVFHGTGILSPTDYTDFSRIWVDPKIVEYYRKLFKIYLGNKNTLRYKNYKKSMRSFCFCPNECNSLHWWAKQKEILYYNEDNLDPCLSVRSVGVI